MQSEHDRIQKIIEDIATGEEDSRKLVYDRRSKNYRAKSIHDDPDEVIDVQPSDADFGCDFPHNSTIVISGNYIEKELTLNQSKRVYFFSQDGGDVFSLFSETPSRTMIPGTIFYTDHEVSEISAHSFGCIKDKIRVAIVKDGTNKLKSIGYIQEYLLQWIPVKTVLIPDNDKLFSRAKTIIETDLLRNKSVCIIGLGSFGSRIAEELTSSGVGNITGVDHDRIEVGNINRHLAGITDVGRYKTKFLQEKLKNKNPYIVFEPVTERVSGENMDLIRELVKKSDIVICATDNKTSKHIINRICVEENKVLIIGGAYPRASGGQVLVVHPHKSFCYQCFCLSLPEQAESQEISSEESAQRVAYSDRPVVPEPGLSNDIVPITSMVVKLAIQNLIKDTQTSLRSLDEDLVASLYIWLNRREQGTQYENLSPLEYNIDGMHILRWYGVDIKPHANCDVCGDGLLTI